MLVVVIIVVLVLLFLLKGLVSIEIVQVKSWNDLFGIGLLVSLGTLHGLELDLVFNGNVASFEKERVFLWQGEDTSL